MAPHSKQEIDMNVESNSRSNHELAIEELDIVSGGHPNPVIDTVLSVAYDTACKGTLSGGVCGTIIIANHPAPPSQGC